MHTALLLKSFVQRLLILVLVAFVSVTFLSNVAEAKTVKRGIQTAVLEIAWNVVGGSGTCNGDFVGIGYPNQPDGIRTAWLTSHTNASSPLVLAGVGDTVYATGTYTFRCTDAGSGQSDTDTLVVTDCLVSEYWNGSTCVAMSIPTLASPSQSAITQAGATLGATVTGDGGSAITARGTCWGTTANPVSNCTAEGGTGISAFSHARTGMTCGTTYYFRGYATNGVGTGYTADSTFATAACSPAPTITDFSGPASVVINTAPTLNWTVSDATSCTINQGVGAAAPASGGSVVAPTISSATTYTLSCMNGAVGPTTAQHTVNVTAVPAPTITGFWSNTPSVPSGTGPTLNWTVTGATSCTINQGVGAAAPTASGSAVAPAMVADTTYTLSCMNGATGPTTQDVLVQVEDPNLTVNAYTFPASPIYTGNSVNLSGTVRNVGNVGTTPAFSNNFSYSYTSATGPWTNLPLMPQAALPPNTTAAPDVYAFTPPSTGTIYFQYCVDSSNQVAEGVHETPNCVQSGPVTVQVPPPTPVTNLTATTSSQCGAGIFLSWTPSVGADGYWISLDNGWTWPTYVPGPTSTHTLIPTPITPNQLYSQIVMDSVNWTGSSPGPFAGPVSARTSAACTSLSGTSCTVANEGNSCMSVIYWNLSGAASPILYNVTRNILIASWIGNSTNHLLNYGPNLIESRDGATVLNSVTLNGVCSPTSFWYPTANLCKGWPVITSTPSPALIRSGQKATLNFSVTASYPVTCNFTGGMSLAAPIVHSGTPTTSVYTRETNTLTSAQVIRVTCNTPTNDIFPAYTQEFKVNVLPAVQEI